MNDGKYKYLGGLLCEAMNLGYTLEVDNYFNITLKKNDRNKVQPDIDVSTHCKSAVIEGKVQNTYYFTVAVAFPELKSTDMEFADDFEAITGYWEKVGRFITSIITTTISPEDYQ